MGMSRFSDDAYTSYSTTHRLKSAALREVFSSRHMPQALDPSKIDIRESCDSEANPNSTPIVLALDVTGSMGFVAEKIAKDHLPEIMRGIYEQQPVTDPHLMFHGVGDVFNDDAPLQVSQFEAGATELIEQLRSLYLEGRGGGNNFESYDLPWYFCATKTKIDSYDKRGLRGFIFTMGDELPPQRPLTVTELTRVFGPGAQAFKSTEELLAEVEKRYQVFHLVIEEGNYARSRGDSVRGAWTELLGPNAIFVEDVSYLPQIIIATLAIAAGRDLMDTISNYDQDVQGVLRHAFTNAIAEYTLKED